MEYAEVFLLFLVLVTVVTDKVLARLGGHKGKGFPKCLECKNVGVRMPTIGTARPDDINYTMQKYGIPEIAVTRYRCPKGCTYMWWIPQMGKMPKGIIRSQKIV